MLLIGCFLRSLRLCALLSHVFRSLGCGEPLQVFLPQLRPGSLLPRPVDLGDQVFQAFVSRPGEVEVVHLPLL
jgi:hypothetical protein